MIKKVVVAKKPVVADISEVTNKKIYVCRFHCADIAVATRVDDLQPLAYYTWYSIKGVANHKVGTNCCSSLRELILDATNKYDVYQFDTAKDFGEWLSDYPEYGFGLADSND